MRKLVTILLTWAATSATADTCVECHAELEDELLAPVHLIDQDAHSRQGLSCADCHGGDPDSDDPDISMDWDAGFVGVPERDEIPALCGRCHSDATFIRQYNPGLRIDQEALYATSYHGQLLMEGDDKVATCTDCHGDHGILPAIDPRSPVYPANVPNTCGQCHSDADYMAEYGIPTNQLEEYRRSVHGKPLLERHDMSAPACNDCHGNHGATPPGVSSLANVCGQCHPVNNDLVNQSSHRPAFEHLGIAACKTCHSHHDIRPPTDEMVGTSGAAVCVQCHSPEVRAVTLAAGTGAVTDAGLERGWQAAATMRSSLDSLRIAHAEAEGLVRRAERAGMSVEDALYDLHESQGRLTRARSVLHAFQTEQVVETSQEGLDLAAQAHQRGLQALDDLDYRRRGLALSLLVIAVVGTALYAKIRSLDHDESPAQRRQRGGE